MKGNFFHSATEQSLTGRGEREDREGLQWREDVKSEQLQWWARDFEERDRVERRGFELRRCGPVDTGVNR